MSTLHRTSSTPREKGVRRPLGDLTLNRTKQQNGNHNKDSSSLAKVTANNGNKPGIQKPALLSKQHRQSSSSSSVESFSSSSQTAASIFRPLRSAVGGENEDDVLTLKPANPINEDIQEETDDDDDMPCLPFVNDNHTRVFEPFDERQLRSIFRKTPTDTASNLFDDMNGMLSLKRANPVFDYDDDDKSGEQDETLLERTAELQWDALVSEDCKVAFA